MSDSYKKYIDKAKKNKESSEDSKRKQETEFKDLYAKFHLKYAMGTPSVAPANSSANTASSLSPLLKEQYAGKDKKKKFHDLKPGSNSESPSYYNEGGQVEEPQQKTYQAKEYFGKGDGDSAGPLSRMHKGGEVKKYADGTPDVSENAKGFLDSIKKAFNAPEPTPTPIPSLEDKYKKIRHQNLINNGEAPGEINYTPDTLHYDEGTANVQAGPNVDTNKTQQAQDSLRKAFHFADGGEVNTSAMGELQNALRKQFGTPDNSKSNTPNTDTKTTDQKTKSAEGSIRDAFHFSKGGQVETPYQKYMRLFGGTKEVPEIKNPLAGLHAPVEKKYPLNIPRAGHIGIPKRLKPVTDIRGYDDGGQVSQLDPKKVQDAQDSLRKAFHFAEGTDSVPKDYTDEEISQMNPESQAFYNRKKGMQLENTSHMRHPGEVKPGDISNPQMYADGTPDAQPNTMDLGDIPITPSTPYPGEEEQAQQVTDQSTQGQIQKMIDEHNQGQDVLQQIDQALGKETNPEDYKKLDHRELSGMTLNKDEALGENPDKSLEDQYKSEEDVAEKAADNAPKEEEPKAEPSKEEVKDSEDKSKVTGPEAKLLAAQKAQNNITMFNQLGKATDIMGASMGHFKPQYGEIYDQNIKDSDIPVKQLEQQIAMEKFDPSSDTSKAFRQYLTKFGGQDVADLGDISAAQAESIAPMAFKQFEAQQAQQARSADLAERNKERLQQAKIAADQRTQSNKDRLELQKMIMQQRQDAQDEKNSKKLDDDQNKAYQKMRKDLETFRGNQGVQQASRDVLSANKALQLVQDKDPNTLTTQDLSLLSDELGKIATGGVPTESGTRALMPNNLQTKWAEMKNFLLSKPTDANAAAYIKKNMTYLKQMQGVADKSIGDYRMNLARGYKNLVKPDDFQEALGDYNLTPPVKTVGQVPGAPQAAPQAQGKTVVKKGYNPATNQTQFIYNDGTKEIKDGKL